MPTAYIRGATTIEKDDKKMLFDAVNELIKSIIDKNELDISDIRSFIFTATKDIKSAYPAEAVRKMGITGAALMCFQEMDVEGSLSKCIRVMAIVEGEKYNPNIVKHVYLNEAKKLRPDLAENN